MYTRAEIERDRQALKALVGNAQAELRAILARVPSADHVATMSDSAVVDLYEIIRGEWWKIADRYGTMGAVLGQAQASMMMVDGGYKSPKLGIPVGIPDADSTASVIITAMGQDDWQSALTTSLDGTVKTANTWSICDTLNNNGADLIWYPQGTTCRYCLKRASHGAYSNFRSEAQARGFATRPHDHCVMPDTLVHGPALGIGVRRQYDGDVVAIVTALGNNLTVTPNHPVLTRRGWVPAEFLHEGDDLLAAAPVERDVSGGPNEDDAPARAEHVFGALAMNPGVIAVTVPGAPEQFHGDGMDSEVEIVVADGLLGDEGKAGCRQPLAELDLSATASFDSARSLTLDGCGAGEFGGLGLWPSTDGVVGSGCLGGAFCGSHPRCTCEPGLRASTDRDTGLDELSADGLAMDAERLGDGVLTLAGKVPAHDLVGRVDLGVAEGDASLGKCSVDRGRADSERLSDVTDAFPGEIPGSRLFRDLELLDHVILDSVTAIARHRYSGLVYNFTSADGWYFANSIVTHNCDCRPVVVPADGTYPDDYHPTEYARQVEQMDRAKAVNALDRRLDGQKSPGPKTRDSVRRDASAKAWADRQRITRERDAAKNRLARAITGGDTAAADAAQAVLDRTAAERARLNGTR